MKKQAQQCRKRSNENFQKRLKTYWKYIQSLRKAHNINAYIFLRRHHQTYIINTIQRDSNRVPTVEDFIRSQEKGQQDTSNGSDRKFKNRLNMLWKKSNDLKTLYETSICAFICSYQGINTFNSETGKYWLPTAEELV
jgi:hypothetical protein